jgi:hypothetical protein
MSPIVISIIHSFVVVFTVPVVNASLSVRLILKEWMLITKELSKLK